MPMNAFDTLIAEIKARISLTAEQEGHAILSVIELARLYVRLKNSVRKHQWEKTLGELGVNPRVASRYLLIGERWSTPENTPCSAILSQLPCDVHKLEWLARVNPEELSSILKIVDCKTGSRGAVIRGVQRLLGERPAASDERQSTVEDVKKRWSDYIRRTVDAIYSLPDPDVDGEARQQLLEALQVQFAEVEDALLPSGDSDDQPQTEEGEQPT